MAYAIHRHPHRHITLHDEPRRQADGGWWKFALAAAIMTAVAVVLVTSPVLRRSPSVQTVSNDVTPAVIFLPPVITDLNPVMSTTLVSETLSSTSVAAEPVQASLAPVVADTTTLKAVAPIAAPQTTASLHDVNFATLPSLQTLASQLGGSVDTASIKYADVTGDGSDEAVVPITSDGTAGTLAFVVLTQRNGSPTSILTRQAARDRRGLATSFDNGQLTESSGFFGPSDANCCPSQIVRTYFRYDGTNLVVDHTNTLTIPTGKQAD